MLECPLRELLREDDVVTTIPDITVKGLSLDSRQLQAGWAFVALPGLEVDGRDFIAKAQQANASCVLLPEIKDYHHTIPQIVIPNLKSILGNIASRFYQHPSKQLTMTGITGTNGKTSICHFLAQAYALLGQKCAIAGTAGNGLYGELQQSKLTTLDAIQIQAFLATMLAQGAKAVAIEVSSHGLTQHRVTGIDFNIGVFTNLTHEHLDYHGSMENYAAAKSRLFSDFKLDYAIINADDDYSSNFINTAQQQAEVFAFSRQNNKLLDASHMMLANNVQLNTVGISADIVTPWGDASIQLPLLGHFNIDNLLVVIAVLCLNQFKFTDVINMLPQLHEPKGRMQAFGGKTQPLVVVDYSHTPDALQQALMSLRQHVAGSVFCVFGCGGNRDISKRQLMGKVASEFADNLVITNDNPRKEDPEEIINDILKGIVNNNNICIESDRAKAIALAVRQADSGDAILVAGKGHEDYQIIGDKTFAFDDVEIVKALLKTSI